MLVILEGLDRVGKTTVAEYFKSKGYEVVHMSAPSKNSTPDSFLQEMIDLISSAATRDICLDRSYYGECFIWPEIYGRKSLLSEENLEILREIEDSVGTQRVYMFDPKVEEHWQRCVKNKEPLTKAQFTKARALYSQMASKYDFELITLPAFIKEYPEAGELDVQKSTYNDELKTHKSSHEDEKTTSSAGSILSSKDVGSASNTKTAEQIKLEKANAINDILSKRILKQRGDTYDTLENDIRVFLNTKLSQLFGTIQQDQKTSLTSEEVTFYKAMFKRAMKESK